MNSKDKQIIEKLLSLATKQQKVLTKLAQANAQYAQNVDANKEYLKRTWQTAGLNTGISAMSTPTVEYTAGGPGADGITIGDNYVVSGVIPANQREKFLATFKAQVSAQKPELDGKVSTIFKDPTAV